MDLALIGRALGVFAATNIDTLVVLALFFGRAGRDRAAEAKVVAGQYLGFLAILAFAFVGSLGVELLPDAAPPYFGLIPLALGLRLAWRSWRSTRAPDAIEVDRARPAVLAVAAVTLSNGGDNIGVYIPVFAAANSSGLAVYIAVFLALVAVWCAAGRFLATRPLVARALWRWDHILLPVILVGIGLAILVRGGAFGL